MNLKRSTPFYITPTRRTVQRRDNKLIIAIVVLCVGAVLWILE